jgi:hypothetical protein
MHSAMTMIKFDLRSKSIQHKTIRSSFAIYNNKALTFYVVSDFKPEAYVKKSSNYFFKHPSLQLSDATKVLLSILEKSNPSSD